MRRPEKASPAVTAPAINPAKTAIAACSRDRYVRRLCWRFMNTSTSTLGVSGLWTEVGEEDHIPEGGGVGEDHEQAVDAEAEAARWRHSVLQRLDEVLVVGMSLLVTGELGLALQ